MEYSVGESDRRRIGTPVMEAELAGDTKINLAGDVSRERQNERERERKWSFG